VKIGEIRELRVPLNAKISNSLVSFAEHDVSLVAVISDVMRHGRPVVGLGFNSIGRFAQSGILRERILPRILSAPAAKSFGENSFHCALWAYAWPKRPHVRVACHA